MSRLVFILAILLTALGSPALLGATDLVPPSAPAALIAKVASCGQVGLSWTASTDEVGGSGLYAYIIQRWEGGNLTNEVAIGAARTTFSDTNYVKSSSTMSYTVVAQDNAGNRSARSNTETVITPACPSPSYGEQVIGDAAMEPLGKAIATYGTRTAFVSATVNALSSTLDTWLYIRDEDTNQTSRFLLHNSPGYKLVETDYVLTSATELWTAAYDLGATGGKVRVSQYKLNGSPIPTSPTLVSTRWFGGSHSNPKSMIRLKSGALVVAWNDELPWPYLKPDGSADTGFAYRSPTGNWTVQFPVTIPSTTGASPTQSQMALAQHPSDGSIWAFSKRDSFHEIIGLHFTELSNGLVLDWIRNNYIAQSSTWPVPNNDGINGPEVEFPFLSAIADPTRNAILLVYQRDQYQLVFVDPLVGTMNSISLTEATAAITQIQADGSKTFIPFPTYIERAEQFGLSVLPDGTIWLTYQPINHQTLTWNEVHASSYFNNTWSTAVLVGFNYNDYNILGTHRDPGLIAYRNDRPQVAFRTPDQKIHAFILSSSAPLPPADTLPPTTSITSPADGATVSGAVTVQATASDDTGVAQVDLLVDGVMVASKTVAPYTFLWDTSTSGKGNHTLQTIAHDIAANIGDSTLVTATVADTTRPVVSITNPLNGVVAPRNTTVTITATATDDVGVTKVEFYVGGKLLAADTNSPYAATWKVPGKNNTSYTIQAVAYDAAGNSAAATSTVTAK